MGSLEETLCRKCGLCCDGTLFADVLVRAAELPPIKAEIVYERRRPDYFLQQPCAAFCQDRCQVYADRPSGCRQFECLLLKQTKQGKMPVGEALDIVRKTKARVSRVQSLLESLGETDTSLPLSFRYDEALSQAWDLSEDEGDQRMREELYREATELETQLLRNFRPDAETSRS